MIYRNTLALLVALFLVACAAPNPRPPEINPQLAWENKKVLINNLSRWRAEGHAAIIAKKESGNLNMDWRQNYDDYDVRLIAPFGKKLIRIQRTQNLVTLFRPGRPAQKSLDAENLFLQELGWALPVGKLSSWLKGVINEPIPFSLDQYGRIQSFQYRDWYIEYKAYQSAFGYELPKSIYLTNKELEIRLAIEKWHDTPAAKTSNRRFTIPQ